MIKQIFYILLLIGSCFMFGCGVREDDYSESYATWEQSGYGYLSEDGYYFTADSDSDPSGIMMYYFDRISGECVPVCDKAECDHSAVDFSLGETPTCNAQISTYDEYVIYKDKIYYIDYGERQLILCRRNTDGNNDEEVTTLNAAQMGGRMWFYRDYAFLLAITDVSQSFDPGTGESDQRKLCFFCVNLKTGETETLGESVLTAAICYAFNIYKMEKGKVYYYDLERDSWYIFDTDKAEVEEQTEIPEKAKFGEAGEYIDIYGKYCYEIFGTVSDGQTIQPVRQRNRGRICIVRRKSWK